MKTYLEIFQNNRQWAKHLLSTDPGFFSRHAAGQAPNFLFIGCCDSRVPIELLTGAKPGEVFTHRNIGNQVHRTDMNVLSVLDYAVSVLKVPHIIVCGHYECGGIAAAMKQPGQGIVDNWLEDLRDIHYRHAHELDLLADDDKRQRRLVELNVLEQVLSLSRTPVVQHAWEKGERPVLHGIVYDVHDGLLRELVSNISSETRAMELRTVLSRDVTRIPVSLHASDPG
jgi:carbonic anhydrase